MATKERATLYAQDAIRRTGSKCIIYRIGPHWMYHPYTTETLDQLTKIINHNRVKKAQNIQIIGPNP